MQELIQVNEPQFHSEDHYKLLGVDLSATSDDIRSAYRRLTLQYHPDRTTNENTALYIKIKNAYETLRDPERRATYDANKRETHRADSFARTLQLELDRAELFWRGRILAAIPAPVISLPVTPILPIDRNANSRRRVQNQNPPMFRNDEPHAADEGFTPITMPGFYHSFPDEPSSAAANHGFFRGPSSNNSTSAPNSFGNSRSASNAPRNNFDNLLASLYLDLLLSPLLSNSTNNMEMLDSVINDYLNLIIARSLQQRLNERFANSIPAAAGGSNSGVSILIIIIRRNSGMFSGVGANQQSANSKIEVPKLSENHQKLDDIKFDEKQIPEEYICPLSLNVMSDPVFNPSKGLPNVERSWILIEIGRSGKNPFTNLPLDVSDLQSNGKLKEQIDKFVDEAVKSHKNEQPKM